MLKNAFKKYPPQNRTNVQIKGGGGQRPFEQCSKKLHFFEMRASLREGFKKSKWKFKMAFAMKGGGVSRGSRVPFTYFEK